MLQNRWRCLRRFFPVATANVASWGNTAASGPRRAALPGRGGGTGAAGRTSPFSAAGPKPLSAGLARWAAFTLTPLRLSLRKAFGLSITTLWDQVRSLRAHAFLKIKRKQLVSEQRVRESRGATRSHAHERGKGRAARHRPGGRSPSAGACDADVALSQGASRSWGAARKEDRSALQGRLGAIGLRPSSPRCPPSARRGRRERGHPRPRSCPRGQDPHLKLPLGRSSQRPRREAARSAPRPRLCQTPLSEHLFPPGLIPSPRFRTGEPPPSLARRFPLRRRTYGPVAVPRARRGAEHETDRGAAGEVSA